MASRKGRKCCWHPPPVSRLGGRRSLILAVLVDRRGSRHPHRLRVRIRRLTPKAELLPMVRVAVVVVRVGLAPKVKAALRSRADRARPTLAAKRPES